MQARNDTRISDLLECSFDGAWGPVDDSEKGAPVLRSTDMRGGQISFSDVAYRQIPAKTLRNKALRDGDILVNKSSGSAHLVGASVLFKRPDDNNTYICSNFIRCLRPQKDTVLPEYFHFALQSPAFRQQVFGAQRTTSGLRNLKITEYLAAEIPVPPLDEQHRIVDRIKECMERIDEIRELRAEALKEAEACSAALIEDLIADAHGVEVSLGSVCGIESGLVDPREKGFSNLLHVGGANIKSGTGTFIELKTAKEEGLISGKHLFGEKDVLYSKIRPYLRKVARPGFRGLCSADMYPLRPREDALNRDFLFLLLLSRDFTNYANSVSNRAGMPKINRKDLFAYRFILPSLDEQEELAQILDSAFSSALSVASELRQSNKALDAIQEAILRKAFAGEL